MSYHGLISRDDWSKLKPFESLIFTAYCYFALFRFGAAYCTIGGIVLDAQQRIARNMLGRYRKYERTRGVE